MRERLAVGALALCSATAWGTSTEGLNLEVRRSMAGDKGRYFIVEMKRGGPTVHILHKRIGPSGTSYTRTEIDCNTKLMRVIAESDDRPPAPTAGPATRWFQLVPGSSKADLFNFVCSYPTEKPRKK